MNYSQIGAAVLAACIAYDPYSAHPSAETAKAWGRLFEKHHLSVDDLLAAVDGVYEQHGTAPNGDRYKPLPKDIVDAARAIRRDRDAETGPTPEYEALCESKFISYEESLARIRARTGQQALGRGLGEAS
jgi:hypothetical protein